MLKLQFTIQACILISSLYITTTVSFDYCSISCKHEDVIIKQIICERAYNCSSPAYGCIKFQNASLTPEEKDFILNEHNQLRSTVALGETNFALKHITAADMNELVWDSELELIALCWVNTCGMYDDDLDSVCLDTEYAESGYNVAFKRISVLSNELKSVETLEEHIQGWFSEVEGFTVESVDNYPSDTFQRKLKRFSQLIWAETTHLGCARSVYGQYITMFVCVYSPSGNIDDKPVFIKGPPCSKCAYGICSKKYEGLCKVTTTKTGKLTRTTKTTTITTSPSIASTKITKITNLPNLTTHTTNTSTTTTATTTSKTHRAKKHFKKIKNEKKKKKKKAKRPAMRKFGNTLTTNVVTVNVQSEVTVVNKIDATFGEIPADIMSPVTKRTTKRVLEGRHAVQPVVANKVCRNDKSFVKDFGLFVVGMLIIFK